MRRSERKTGGRVRLAPILLAAFILVPLAEIAVLIRVGSWLGLLPTLALIVLTAVIGTVMLRQQGFAVLTRAQRQLEQGVMPVAEVFEGLCLLVAGALLLAPGFITDTCGALLLLPPVRSFIYRRVGGYLERQVVRAADAPPGGRPPGREPPVLDGKFEEVDPDDDLPPPRGGWDGKR
jgi:UPF0716 protein FxsA